MLRLSSPSSSSPHQSKRPYPSTFAQSNDSYISSIKLPYPSKAQGSQDLPSFSLGSTFQTAITINNGQISLAGTIHGKIFSSPTIQRPQLPHLKCTQISFGQNHVIALFERSVTMSWGSGYFGKLGLD